MDKSRSVERRNSWRVAATVGLLAVLCLWASFQFIEPLPPREIVIASGPEASLLHEHAQRYVKALARHGVRVVERMTEGAGENLHLLGDKASGVDIAFVQGGQADSPEAAGVEMLASLYYQPLWIFTRRGEAIDSLADDQGFFESPGEFPNVDQVDLRVSPHAIRHKRFGPSLLYRYLPFWVAAVVEWCVIILVPLLVIVVPIARFLPATTRWHVRSRIFRCYGELKLLERDVERRRGTLPIEQWLADLDRVERSAAQICVRSSFAGEAYTLREHIALVRRSILGRATTATAS